MTEVFGGDVVGSAFVRIQPTIGDDFGQTLGTGIQRQVSRTGAGRIALSGDTTRLESDVGSAFDRIAVKGAAVLGGIFAVDKVTGWISQGFNEATLQKLGEVNAKALFGPQAQGIVDTAKNARAAATETSAAFLTSTNQIGQFFGNIGLGGDKAASMAEQVATLAGQLSALNPNLGDAQTLTTGLLRAMETGQARALAPFGLTIKKSAIDAEALAHHLGTTSQNTADLALKTQHVTDLQQQLSDLQAGKGTASANQVAAAQDRVRLATGNQAKALAEHGASSNQYLSAHASLLSAEQSLSDVQGRGADNAKKVADTTAQLAKAKSDLADAAAKVTVTLTPEEQAQATLFAVLDQAAGVQDRYTAAVQAGALAAPQAQTAWDQALGDLGDRLLPNVASGLQDLTTWLDSHQQDFASAGSTIGNAFGTARDVFGWLIDHRGPIEGALGAIAAVWAADKVAGWGKDIFTVVKGLATLDPKVLERLIPGLSGILGSGGGKSGVLGLGSSVASMSVGEMTVGSMITGAGTAGVPAVGGTSGGAGGVAAADKKVPLLPVGAGAAGVAAIAAPTVIPGDAGPIPPEQQVKPPASLSFDPGDVLGHSLNQLSDPTGSYKQLATALGNPNSKAFRYFVGRFLGDQDMAGDHDTLVGTVRSAEDVIGADLGEAVVKGIDAARDQAQATLTGLRGSAASTLGLPSLLPGGGVVPGGGAAPGAGISFYASGSGWLSQPRLAVVGDANVRERVIREDDYGREMASGGGGTQIDTINVYNPTTDVDVVTAMSRAVYHSSADRRGYTAGPAWRPDLAAS